MSTTANVHTSFAAMRTRVQQEILARLPDHISRMSWSRERIEAAQRDGLRVLLTRAVEDSPFHRRRLRGIDPTGIRPDDLSRLPVMTKAEMMDSLDDVFTERRLTRAAIERALEATTTEPVPILDHYTALATGGSSGRRGVFAYDEDGIVSHLLSLSRPLMAGLLAMGGPPPGGFVIGMVAAASAVHGTGAGHAWGEGGTSGAVVVSVPVTLPVPEIVQKLNALRPHSLVGYATILARLAIEKRAGRLAINPGSVTTTSETLTDEMRSKIRDAFGVPISDTYGSSEGLVGASAPDDNVLAFNSDLCIVETVDDQNRPVAQGVPSTRILLTNLYNLTQPLIRYVMEDSFVRFPDAATRGHLRARVMGRAEGVLHYDGADIHPHVIRSVMVRSPEVLDYRVKQTSRGMDIDAIAVDEFDCERLADRVEAALSTAGLRDSDVKVRIVESLPRDGRTGKLRRFVPLQNP